MPSSVGGEFVVPNVRPFLGRTPGSRAALGGVLLLAAMDAAGDIELWRTDGTEVGTTRVKDIRPGPNGSMPQELTTLGSVVLFTADDGCTVASCG